MYNLYYPFFHTAYGLDYNTVETGLLAHALMGSIAELYVASFPGRVDSKNNTAVLLKKNRPGNEAKLYALIFENALIMQ